MKKASKFIRKALSVLFAIVLTVSAFSSASGAMGTTVEASTQSQYEKPDISDITNEGGNPEEIGGSASALGVEKQWYEYIQYCYTPVDLLWARPTLDTQYFDDAVVIFGHTPTEFFDEQYRGKVIKTKSWICIDTGAATGNKPMLLRLEDLKEFY